MIYDWELTAVKNQNLLWVWACAAGTIEEPVNTFAVLHPQDAKFLLTNLTHNSSADVGDHVEEPKFSSTVGMLHTALSRE